MADQIENEVWAIGWWRAWCQVQFAGTLVILGPACKEVGCTEPARWRVHWPSGLIECCDRHADRWRKVAEKGLGMHLHVEEMFYSTNEDAAVQRFRNMEMD